MPRNGNNASWVRLQSNRDRSYNDLTALAALTLGFAQIVFLSLQTFDLRQVPTASNVGVGLWVVFVVAIGIGGAKTVDFISWLLVGPAGFENDNYTREEWVTVYRRIYTETIVIGGCLLVALAAAFAIEWAGVVGSVVVAFGVYFPRSLRRSVEVRRADPARKSRAESKRSGRK